jgi:sporulation protein YlmC with PRC-barrel domain
MYIQEINAMLKKHMAACLVVTAFAAAPAFAQTASPSAPTDRPTASGSGSATSGSSAMQPGASGSGAMSGSTSSSSTMGQSSGMQGQFMTQMQPNQIMASDLIGTRVVSANNESIGDINDVIVDRNGQAVAAVVGVGGFLGIGEKDVAVPFNSLEFANSQQANAMDNNNSGNTNVTTTGSTATGSNTNAAANNTSSSDNNQPQRVILRMTKAELQAAPRFNADNNSSTGSAGATGQSGSTTSTAPKQ